MLNNKKGVTLIALIVTMIIMIIIAGIAIASNDIISRAEQQQIYTEMSFIRTKVKILMEKASFSGDTNTYYIGTPLAEMPNKAQIAQNSLTAEELNQDTFYVYNQGVLDTIGLGNIVLPEGKVYIVNYANGEVIYPDGIKISNDETIYRFSEF